ncbi:MAG: hypothetical protein KH275_01150 [Clostridiales bacterium]|nr:hypothetical protein [Clostridiales bacterium]
MSTKTKIETVNVPATETRNQEEKTMEKIEATENKATRKPADITKEFPISEEKQEVTMDMKESTKSKVTATGKTAAKKAPAKAQKPAEKQNPGFTLSEDKKREIIEKVSGEVITSATEAASIHLEAGRNLATLRMEISQHVVEIRKSYLLIAMKVQAIHNRKLYKAAGYTNIADMTMREWNLSPATTSCFLNICNRFGIFDPKTGDCIGLRPEYEGYSSSQLREMLPIPEKYLPELNPKMTVQEIRNRKKYIKSQEGMPDGDVSSPVKTPEKASRKKSLELLTTNSLADLDNVKSKLLEKLDEFETSHPDTQYHITVNLSYEEVTA